MSGGSMDYICFQVKEHVGCFEDKELDELLDDMAELLHEREWFLSGENCEGKWNLAKKEFKEKWLDGEEHMDYCKDCKHFTNGKENSFYGKCKYEKFCLTHKYEYGCDKFKGSDE